MITFSNIIIESPYDPDVDVIKLRLHEDKETGKVYVDGLHDYQQHIILGMPNIAPSVKWHCVNTFDDTTTAFKWCLGIWSKCNE